jgi:uncharacterized protein YndB with AHSA1/START domain
MRTVRQTHEYDASPTTVFQHLTDTKRLDTWWTTGSVSEPRVGGKYRYEFFVTKEAKKAGKQDHKQEGTYTVFEPAKALAYPWDYGRPTQVRFDFEAHGKGTRLRLVHTDIPDDDEAEGMLAGGWQFFLANLKSVLEDGKDNRAAMGLAVPVAL